MADSIVPTTVAARDVRVGDWVQWPEQSHTMRKVTDTGPPYTDEKGRTYVTLYSEYDDYDYEWLDSQPVVVWRSV